MAEPTAEELATKQINLTIQKFEKTFLRDLRKKECQCCADCCDNGAATIQEVRECIEQCKKPQKIITDYYTTRLTREGTAIFQIFTRMCTDKIPKLEQTFHRKVKGELSDVDLALMMNPKEICYSPMFATFDALVERIEKQVNETIEQRTFESLGKSSGYLKSLVRKYISPGNKSDG